MLILTREQTIIKHRKMWNWLADQYDKGHFVTKADYFHDNHIEEMPVCLCYCCDYVRRHDYQNCFNCPVIWPDGKTCGFRDPGQLYNRYYSLTLRPSENGCLESLAKLSRTIANLPEKEV